MTKLFYKLFFVACLISGSHLSNAQFGTLDPTFGTNGKVVTDINAGSEGANAMALQSDGKIVIASSSYAAGGLDGTGDDVILVRYNTDGSLDKTFDFDGIAQTDFGSKTENYNTLAIQTDGKIVAAGFTLTNGYRSIILARYNNDGSLDITFGTKGKIVTKVGSGYDEEAFSVAIQSDGKIVITGGAIVNSLTNLALLRFNINGSYDTNFGTGGKVLVPYAGQYNTGYCVRILSDGKILVAGEANKKFALTRFLSNGSLDNTFDTDGKLTTTIGVGESAAKSFAIQSDGKIVVVGFAEIKPATTFDFAVARYNSNGILDNTFDTDGTLITAGTEYAEAVGIQNDGKILVAGAYRLIRYNPNGNLDSTFGVNGIRNTPLNGHGSSGDYDAPQAMTIQSDGRVIVAGSIYNSNFNFDIVLLRYNVLTVPAVTFENITRTYGDLPFTVNAASNSPGAITYSITSGGSFASITPEGSVKILGAGTVTIKAEQAGTSTFHSTTALATLTINKSELTVTADNLSKTYNTPNPPLTYTFSGFKYNDMLTSLTTKPTITTTAVTASNASSYPIQLKGGSASNYTFVLKNGTLTVNPATPTLTYTGAISSNAGSIPLTASSNSTGTISYTVTNETGIATVSGTNLILNQAGTVKLTVSIAATQNYRANSIEQTITIVSVTGTNSSQELNAAFEIHPNPSSGVATLNLDMQESINGRIVLCDMNGKELKVIAEGIIDPSGKYDIIINEYNTGIYLIKLHANDKVLVRRLVKN